MIGTKIRKIKYYGGGGDDNKLLKNKNCKQFKLL